MRRKDIEGLRAVAVGLVVLNHAGVPWLQGGYIGVDVFFVISGFLITSLLLNEANVDGGVNLMQFWARRARRILPMSILVTVATVIAGIFMLEPDKIRELTSMGLGSMGFSTNFVLFFTSSEYLSGVTSPSPLRHMWSLSVEEQFYVIWPLVVFACIAASAKRWRLWVGVVGLLAGVVSLLISSFITQDNPNAGYYLPSSRFWEIAAGALLAVFGSKADALPQWLRGLSGWIGVVGIGIAAVLFNDSSVFPGYIALLPVVATVAVLIAGDSGWGPRVMFSADSLQLLGARSYSVYLWHWPVLVLVEARFGTPDAVGKAALIIGVLIVSAVSYRYVEQPIRCNRWLAAFPKRSLGAAGLAISISAAVILYGVASFEAGSVVRAEDGSGSVVRAEDGSGSVVRTEDGAITLLDTAAEVNSFAVLPDVKSVNALLIGDSTMAALRWYEDGKKSLKGFSYTLDVESCRRIAERSCYGREYRTPSNVITALKDYSFALDVELCRQILELSCDGGEYHKLTNVQPALKDLIEPIDLIVMMAGYDSGVSKISNEYAKLLPVVKAINVPVIVLTYKESLKFPAPGSRGKKSVYAQFNTVLREVANRGTSGLISIADWNAYSAGQTSWFKSDGIHLTLQGTLALGAFISTSVASVTDNPCPYSDAFPCEAVNNLAQSMNFLSLFNAKDTNLHCYEDGKSRKKKCSTNRRN